MGSFVPAANAVLPLIDRIFTRIGASDNLSRGRSTFMVEMTETAVILNTARPAVSSFWMKSAAAPPLTTVFRSPGRLSSTLPRTPGPRPFSPPTITNSPNSPSNSPAFATCASWSKKQRAHHLPAQGRAGKADRSYGIEVARLAGLPMGVIERAREILRLHERTEHRTVEELTPRNEATPVQIRLFEPGTDEIKRKILSLRIDEMRPSKPCVFWKSCRGK